MSDFIAQRVVRAPDCNEDGTGVRREGQLTTVIEIAKRLPPPAAKS
ncbi:hypothetical protein [Rhizobium leguminosarum]|nr:hypothetical protein [Rhizobium leguminosarum]